MRLLYIVTTTAKYHDSRVTAIMDTWGGDCADRILFMSDAGGPIPQIVNLGVPSDYCAASLKTVAALLYVGRTLLDRYDWFFVCDDDAFVHTVRLERYAAEKDPQLNACYCERINFYPKLPDLYYPQGGAGYLIGRAVMEKLLPVLPACECYEFSDVTIGVCLETIGCELVHNPGFHSQPPEEYKEKLPDAPIALSFHYIKPERMRTLYRCRDLL